MTATSSAPPAPTASSTPVATTSAPPATLPVASLPAGSLRGIVVGLDPGHNGLNYTDPAYLAKQVWNGREWEDCDTTGTETDGGYPEPRFTFAVAEYLRTMLEHAGATVVMTRDTNSGKGPCVNRRSQIINAAHADVALDIHADGGPSTGRGFAILEPVADGPNDGVISSSERLGGELRSALLRLTPMPTSTYDGVNGITRRDDLAGLNLTTVPKVLVECGNMRNATDAALLVTPAFQRQLARAMAAAVLAFVR
ncbi:MAG TPA: N-acetylmuramoyl-L-alanine amidase [Nocardioidaceae bacterium]|nr:N-acetylmuramoyl-L-alanine amidase [Nocardioidaceae bacterium]